MRRLVNHDEMIQYIYSSILCGCDPEMIEDILDAEMDYLQLKGIAFKRTGIFSGLWFKLMGSA